MQAIEVVEEVIAGLGLDPKTLRAKNEPTEVCWTLKRGSASILITVQKRAEDDAAYLRVASPVMTLPSELTKRNALYKRLLELNATALVNCAFGILGERVVVVSERPAPGLDAIEAQQIIRHLSQVADTYDDRLKKEFAGSGGWPRTNPAKT